MEVSSNLIRHLQGIQIAGKAIISVAAEVGIVRVEDVLLRLVIDRKAHIAFGIVSTFERRKVHEEVQAQFSAENQGMRCENRFGFFECCRNRYVPGGHDKCAARKKLNTGSVSRRHRQAFRHISGIRHNSQGDRFAHGRRRLVCKDAAVLCSADRDREENRPERSEDSHITGGHFKGKRGTVRRGCKYGSAQHYLQRLKLIVLSRNSGHGYRFVNGGCRGGKVYGAVHNPAVCGNTITVRIDGNHIGILTAEARACLIGNAHEGSAVHDNGNRRSRAIVGTVGRTALKGSTRVISGSGKIKGSDAGVIRHERSGDFPSGEDKLQKQITHNTVVRGNGLNPERGEFRRGVRNFQFDSLEFILRQRADGKEAGEHKNANDKRKKSSNRMLFH